MSVYTHTALGAAVGVAAGNPALAFILGALTHVVSDSVAHFDLENVWLEVALAVGAGVFLWWLGGWQLAVLCGMLGGALPDLENLFVSLGILPERYKIFPSHRPYLRHGVMLPGQYIVVQLAVFVVLAGWVYVAPELL